MRTGVWMDRLDDVQETEDMLTQMAADELPVITPLNSKA
jgi:hypothetical protein